jgi:hypothetical protein
MLTVNDPDSTVCILANLPVALTGMPSPADEYPATGYRSVNSLMMLPFTPFNSEENPVMSTTKLMGK